MTQSKPVRLTQEQAHVLVGLKRGGAQTPYQLRASCSTMYRLVDAGYVTGPRVVRCEKKSQPHHRLAWAVTDQGERVARAVIEKLERGA